MDTKNKLKSLTIQGAAVIAFLETLPVIINEINTAVPDLNITANPLVVTVLKYAAIAVVIYGRLRAKTVLK